MIPIISPIEFPGTAESAVSAVSARRVVSRLLVQSGQAPEAPNRRAAMEALRLGGHETWSDLMALPGLVNRYIAMENGHRNSGFSH